MSRGSKAIKTSAWMIVAAGVAAPVLRKRWRASPLVSQAVAYAAPLGLSVAVPRSRKRDVAVCALQMWAYVAAYKAPHDDESAQAEKVHIHYPIAIDTKLGCGELPTVRLQRKLGSVREWRTFDRALVWTHWMWFAVPHTALAWILWRHPSSFVRSAVLTYAVFDLGAIVYWIVPTAPPWYAASMAGRGAELGAQPVEPQHFEPLPSDGAALGARAGADPSVQTVAGAEEVVVRRMMAEYGQAFWKDSWGPLYSVLGGNPLAAMPSLHFATSLMAALLLGESSRLAGALGSVYTAGLGFALVYLGEHYVIDLIAGAGLTLGIRRAAPHVAPLLSRFSTVVSAIERRACA